MTTPSHTRDTRAADTLYLGGFDLVRAWTGTAGDELVDEIETVHVMDGGSRLAIIETQTLLNSTVPSPIAAKWRYQLDDLINSCCVEVGRDGEIISYEEYHPYGTTALLIDTGGEGFRKRYRWSGKERDAESGLVYFGARYFAPWLGRWASADPAGAVDGNPYRVVRGNPVGLREVDGRQSYPVAGRDGNAVGGAGLDLPFGDDRPFDSLNALEQSDRAISLLQARAAAGSGVSVLYSDHNPDDIAITSVEETADRRGVEVIRGATDAADMVDRIIAAAGGPEDGRGRISSLTFSGHGAGAGLIELFVGPDRQRDPNVDPFVTEGLATAQDLRSGDLGRELERLEPYLAPDAQVYLLHCNVAASSAGGSTDGPALLLEFSARVGVPVTGSVDAQFGSRVAGRQVTAFPDGTRTVAKGGTEESSLWNLFSLWSSLPEVLGDMIR